MSGWEDFDRWCDERQVPKDGEATAETFADWLASATGQVVVGGPVGEPAAVAAIPDPFCRVCLDEGYVENDDGDRASCPEGCR